MGVSSQSKILFLAPYPFGRVASQRFRFEQYWDVFGERYQVSFHSFLSEESFNLLYAPGKLLQKAIGVLGGFFRRLFLLFQVCKFDFVFIHREASPIGPPVFEWIIARVFRKKVIYDFDDAIWLSNTSGENRIAALFKCHWKVKYICSFAHKVTCGNDFLCDYAKKFNPDSIYIPTTLDLAQIPAAFSKPNSSIKTIGWTGTHSTLKYLNRILPVLQNLQKQFSYNFLVIADKDPKFHLKNYTFKKWNKATEWEDLSAIDVGLMPLENTEWEEGKCGFKALQYIALGIPAVVSPTEANSKIISNGVNGFVCETDEDWEKKIATLLNEEEMCRSFSQKGRENVKSGFSKEAWKGTYLGLFEGDKLTKLIKEAS